MFFFVVVLDYFPCINGRRVPDSVKCNGVNDCGDDSDEQDCCTYIVDYLFRVNGLHNSILY